MHKRCEFMCKYFSENKSLVHVFLCVLFIVFYNKVSDPILKYEASIAIICHKGFYEDILGIIAK